MKFKVKIKGDVLTVRVKPHSEELLDVKELDRFSRVFLRGFLRPQLSEKMRLEYTGPAAISLQKKLNVPISKQDFLMIMEQIVVVLQNLNRNSLPINHLLMDIQHVFFNEITKEVLFMYIPTVNGMTNMNMIDFIELIVRSVRSGDELDKEFATRFHSFFAAMHPFSVEKIEAYIAREDQNIVTAVRTQNVSQSGFMTNKQQHYYEHYENKGRDAAPQGMCPGIPASPYVQTASVVNSPYVVQPQISSVRPATPVSPPYASQPQIPTVQPAIPVSSPYAAQPQMPTVRPAVPVSSPYTAQSQISTTWPAVPAGSPYTAQPQPPMEKPVQTSVGQLTTERDEATGLLQENERYEMTGLLSEEDSGETVLLMENDVNIHFPSLYRITTGETIMVNKPAFRLGKEKSYVDYFVTNNVAVSRSHADIITRGKQCFVIDLNSTNHTYINGQRIPIHCEVEIHDGDRLKLGNEEFLFNA